jgi:hypothetical protein
MQRVEQQQVEPSAKLLGHLLLERAWNEMQVKQMANGVRPVGELKPLAAMFSTFDTEVYMGNVMLDMDELGLTPAQVRIAFEYWRSEMIKRVEAAFVRHMKGLREREEERAEVIM